MTILPIIPCKLILKVLNMGKTKGKCGMLSDKSTSI